MKDNDLIIDSPIGAVRPDATGAAIGAVRIDPAKSYLGIPPLLRAVINENSESAWNEIVSRINYTYKGLSIAMDALEAETGFSRRILERVAGGQNLLFKPNLVSPLSYDPVAHDPAGTAIATPWPFIAALMRWFHDDLDISYHRMSLAEGATSSSAMAGAYTLAQNDNREITTQAVMEGRSGDFYGGWGFYFVRKYLTASHDKAHTDDPMNGFEESVCGLCLPPGSARDKLMVYDLNKIDDDRSNGRDVPVPDGINFQTITLHKAIVGGDPDDPEDRKAYPGCVLINVPKLKVHVLELLTNAVKNLGIGLYPMEANISTDPEKVKWLYATPDKPIPGMKDRLPHTVWQPERDDITGKTLLDDKGNPVLKKTGGLPATMADVIQAVRHQDILMLHVTDAIEATNGDQAGPTSVAIPEGFAFACEDPVALDVLCARYLFSNVPLAEARRIRKERGLPDDFFRRVPLPVFDGGQIITEEGFDSPIWRYTALRHCEERGIGQQDYHVSGKDIWQDGDLASVGQHLGRIENGLFSELKTDEMYVATGKPLYDLQATTLGYIKANDTLDGAHRTEALFDMYDENGDGVIDYTETGKRGGGGIIGEITRLSATGIKVERLMKIRCLMGMSAYRYLNREWNPEQRDAYGLGQLSGSILTAMAMSRAPDEHQDMFFPTLTWGKGKWPSLRHVQHLLMVRGLFGPGFPDRFSWVSPYGYAFCYADLKWGEGRFTGGGMPAMGNDILGEYHAALSGSTAPLPFTLYVPPGYGTTERGTIPNVQETRDPALLFTINFDDGHEIWRELSPSDFP